jgi:hypothetical protein
MAFLKFLGFDPFLGWALGKYQTLALEKPVLKKKNIFKLREENPCVKAGPSRQPATIFLVAKGFGEVLGALASPRNAPQKWSRHPDTILFGWGPLQRTTFLLAPAAFE